MDKNDKPELVKQFEKIFWVNTPKDWAIKTVYFQKTLYLSALIYTELEGEYYKIRRSLMLTVMENRANDIWGLAMDVADEMRSEIRNRND